MESFKTQNLYQAAFVLCRGFALTGKSKDGSKYVVAFEGKNICQEAIKFYNGSSKVDPKKYSDAYRTLKDFVFEKQMLSLAECRKHLDIDCDLTDAELESVREGLYALARIALDADPALRTLSKLDT